MAIEHGAGGTVITGGHIELARLLALKAALRLETQGLKRSGRPASALVRETIGSTTRSKTVLYSELVRHIEEWKENHCHICGSAFTTFEQVIGCPKCDWGTE